MTNPKYIGLVVSETGSLMPQLSTGSILHGYRLKKVFPFEALTSGQAAARYPEAVIVENLLDIMQDESIELVVLSGAGKSQAELTRVAMEAGKHVRIL